MTHGTDAATLDRPSGRGRKRLALILLSIVAVIAVVLAGGAYAYASSFSDRALPGTTVFGQDVAGQSAEEIASLVQKRADGVTVSVQTEGGESREVPLKDLGVSVDAEATAKAALGRDDSFGGVLKSLWSGEHPVQPTVAVDEKAAADFAKGLVPADRTQPVDAKLNYDKDAEKWSVEPGREGQGVDPKAFVETVSTKAPALESFSVTQKIQKIEPAITTAEAEKTHEQITAMLDQPMSIKGAEDKTYEVSPERRSSWLSVAPDESGNNLAITVDEKAVREWVADRADKTGRKAKNGIEQIDDSGKVVKVIAEKTDGLKVTNTDKVADDLIAALKGATPLEAAFATEKVEAKMTQAKAPAEGEGEAGENPGADAAQGEKWIDINLSKRTVTAYVGTTPVWGPRSMVDGKAGYGTVTGSFEIYLRYDKQDMTNQSRYPKGHPKHYYTKDVPWVQYFHGGYAIHGAPWRSSFGYSGSHGCVNMRVSDAKWLYNWAGIGTRVEVHR